MKFGVCYYPEHWPEARWAEDAARMRQAGIELVRIAEFAWAKMEPAPGEYEWGWLDRAVETLAAAGHAVLLGTPTATPPAWLTQAHPAVRRVEANGRVRGHGTRRHYCPNNPRYREASVGIVTAMAGRYGAHPAVVGWQIDNEFGGGKTARCYCAACAAAFRAWLRRRYGTLEALNAAWGAVFWSQSYTAWPQIPLPDDTIDKKNPSHELDYFRFASDSFVDYQRAQVDVLRRLAPGRFITHNFMGLFRDLDQYDLARDLDFATWDNYPTGNPERWRQLLYPPGSDFSRCDPVYAYDVGDPIITAMAHALTRGLKAAPFWVMEQQCGAINWGDVNPGVRPGTPRLWAWHAAAEGADALVYFRWRATRYAHEQYHSGLLRHDGSADVGWDDQQRLLAEKELLDAVTAVPPRAEVALLFDFAEQWALQLQPHRADFGYLRHLYVYYHALQRLGIPVDLVPPTADLARYRLLLAPTLHMPDAALAARLAAWVAAGGVLLLGVRSGFKTRSNLVTDEPLPGLLRPLAGARVTSWQSLPPGVSWPLAAEGEGVPGLDGAAGYWVETLVPEGAAVRLRYPGGAAALVENGVGNGRCLTLGWYPTAAQAAALLAHLARQQGIARLADLPPGLVAARRGAYTILLNFTDGALAARVNGTDVTVAARDVRVIEI
ncbi:MAG: beta-galactosidase [Anaerolineales bacterium]|nr:beta-galactosidase [Anaerolineales bacterium]